MKTLFATGQALIGLALCAAAGCMTVGSISVNQLPPKLKRQNLIEARASSPIIFAIPFGSAYIDEARANLLSQCNGAIEGTMAKFEDTNYFLGLFATQNVTLQGYCVSAGESPHRGSKTARRRA